MKNKWTDKEREGQETRREGERREVKDKVSDKKTEK